MTSRIKSGFSAILFILVISVSLGGLVATTNFYVINATETITTAARRRIAVANLESCEESALMLAAQSLRAVENVVRYNNQTCGMKISMSERKIMSTTYVILNDISVRSETEAELGTDYIKIFGKSLKQF